MINKPVLKALVFLVINVVLMLVWLRVFKSPLPFLGWACIILHVGALLSVNWMKILSK